jgi:4-amino-4-deoxy-L-arabinose transferase-like glycosyltransferase
MALMTTNVFWRLSTTAISSSDEARYGVAASEMLNAHELVVPTYGGQTEYWNLKPPLGYWMMEGAYALFGRTIWALRLTSAMCALGVVALTMATSRRWFGRRAAILAGLFMTTCFGFLSNHGARSGDLDAALTLILLLTLIQVPRLSSCPNSRLLWSLLLGLGFLLKSFAILPFALATLIYVARTDDEALKWRKWMPAAGVFIGLVGGWGLIRTINDGSAYFVMRMTYEDLFMRSTHVIDAGTYAPWGYVAALVDRFAPWPILVALGCVDRSRGPHAPERQSMLQLLTIWALLPLCLFSFARTQHHWYLDPTYPAWAMLAAVAALKIKGPRFLRYPGGLVAGLTLLALFGCEMRFVARVAVRDPMPSGQVFLASLAECRAAENERLFATFPLSHSERFLLQVADGFDVQDLPPEAYRANFHQPATGLTLFSKRSGWTGLSDPHAKLAVVAENDEYLLIDSQLDASSANGLNPVALYRPRTKCDRFEAGIWQAKDTNGKPAGSPRPKGPNG